MDERRRTVVLGGAEATVLVVAVVVRWDQREDPWPWAGESLAFVAVIAAVVVGLAVARARRNREDGADR